MKGELVILVGPPEGEEEEAFDLDAELSAALKDLSLRDAVALVAAKTKRKKSEVYEKALTLAKQD